MQGPIAREWNLVLRGQKILKDVNDDDDLVISSSGVVLEVNERGKLFYKL
jgi:hypothetical protein